MLKIDFLFLDMRNLSLHILVIMFDCYFQRWPKHVSNMKNPV